MKVKENEGLKELLEDCSKGEWSTPFDGWEFGWSLETESENTYMTIGTNRGPVAIAGVESAFGKDYIVGANAALIAMAPNMAREIISLRERMDEKEAENERLREIVENLHKVEKRNRDVANHEFHRAEKAEAVADQFADLIKSDLVGVEWKRGCREALAAHTKLKGDV